AVVRLARVGYDNTLGYLKGGVQAWIQAGLPTEQMDEIEAPEFAELYKKNPEIKVLDVRREAEYNSQHIEGTINFPLDFINSNMSMLDKNSTYYIHCAGGYR
ncbi:MBL fold metallo-hydrolase, partial [Flavihumibacter sediminis]|nr:MBL fold metallo-hydrolase [Flavihumibacter sediminis]